LPSKTPIACTARDTTGTPPFSEGASASNIACMMRGTPAITCTLPMMKPGAETGGDQHGAARHRRHALAGRVESQSADRGWRSAAAISRPGFLVRLPGHAEGAGDAFGGDVVMRRADAAGGEDIGVFRPHLVHRGDDRLRHIGDDACLAQRDAHLAEAGRQELQVGVLGAAGQHLVADDQQAGGGIHGRPRSARQGGA
jgi:hypothetical protein